MPMFLTLFINICIKFEMLDIKNSLDAQRVLKELLQFLQH